MAHEVATPAEGSVSPAAGKTGRIWWSADNKEEAEKWKADYLAKGAISVELKPDTDRPIVDVIITLERSRARAILGYEPEAEEWMIEDDEGSQPAESKQADMRYVVEVLCSGMGYAQSKHGGATIEEARKAEDALRADDAAWVNPAAPRQTRIRDTVTKTTHSRY